jgi:Glutaredoxin-like domain (DUF836)
VIKELFLYTSKDCKLCSVMQENLEKILPARGISCHLIDIEDDPELKHRYGARLPVLVGGNKEICELVFDSEALESFISDNS